MLVRLFGEQIPPYWEAIQYGWLQTNPLPLGADAATYLNNLLTELLSGQAQAWLIADVLDTGQKNVHAVAVTRIVEESLTGMCTVVIQALYGFRHISDDLVREAYSDFLKYAKNVGARRVKFYTTNPRVKQLASLIGATLQSELYSMEVL